MQKRNKVITRSVIAIDSSACEPADQGLVLNKACWNDVKQPK